MRRHIDSNVWKAMMLGVFILGGCVVQEKKASEKKEHKQEEVSGKTPEYETARDTQLSVFGKDGGFHSSSPRGGEGTPWEHPIEFKNDGSVHIRLETKGDSMAYTEKRIVVPAETHVAIDFKNNATRDVMVHNVVIVEKGHADEVGVAALSVGPERGYIPDLDAVLAHSALVGPGESTYFEFSAPPPGEYDFICTYPGHYAFMRGVFVVEASERASTGRADVR